MLRKSDDKTGQYFIALIPPSPVYEQALTLKNYFRDNYNSKASLNSPPHITLHMPFRWKEKREEKLIDSLQAFSDGVDPFKVCLDNFSAFPPRVIFINVVNNEALDTLQKMVMRFCKRELNLFNANFQAQPFHPHITLAFRDLKKPVFKKAWEEFSTKEYKAEFIADKITLLKHTGKLWAVFREFGLESSYTVSETSNLTATEG